MTQDPANIEKAFRQAFFAAIPGAVGKTAFENQPFDPKTLAKWYIFNFLPNEPTVASLGNVGTDKFSGIVQIDINIPPGAGKGDVDADVLNLRSAFTAGAKVSYSDGVATVQSCGRKGGGRLVNSFYRFTVSLSWESRLSRN